jgi:uncharacterized protein YyaL (SSP411 family)
VVSNLRRCFTLVMIATLASFPVANADEGWSKFIPSQKLNSPYLLYVTTELLCDECTPAAFIPTKNLPAAFSSAQKFWISSANQPEFSFLAPANSRSGLSYIAADGEILSFVDESQVTKLSITAPTHFEPAAVSALTPTQRVKCSELHYSGFDPASGGTRKLNKTFSSALTYSLSAAMQGDEKEGRMAKITLDNALKLVDQVWGGVFDNGVNGSWSNINYQKSATVQGDALLAFSLGFRQFRDDHYLNAARGIVDFIRVFLRRSEGQIAAGLLPPNVAHAAEYFSLSDSERRKKGLPILVTNHSIIAAGKILTGLAELYPFMPDEELAALVRSISNSLKSEKVETKLSLLEISWSIRGLIAAYEVLGDRSALLSAIQYAERASSFLSPSGFVGILASISGTSSVVLGVSSSNSMQFAEALVRLHHLTGRAEFLSYAKRAFGSAIESVDNDPDVAANTLKVDSELTNLPAHLTVVGPRGDSATQGLFLEALKVPSAFRRVELWDKSEGGLVNPDVKYPELSKPAAFICTEKRCSLPIFTPEKIPELWVRLKKR